MIRYSIFYIFLCIFVCSIVTQGEAISDSNKSDSVIKHQEQAGYFNRNTMCGPNCLWQIAKAFGKDCSLADIVKYADTDAFKGTTVKNLVEACRKIGIPAEALKTNLKGLSNDPRVAILLLTTNDYNHYVILDSIKESNVRLLDANNFLNLSTREFKSIWDGYAILIGAHENNQSGQVHRYIGYILQVSGILIILVLIIHILKQKHLFIHS